MFSKKICLVCLILVSLLLIWWTHARYSSTPAPQVGGPSLALYHAASDIARRTERHCRDKICSEYLTKADYPFFNYCIRKTWKTMKHPEPETSVCQFMNGVGRDPVALASYPGSGNTWVRGLLQEVTGLCTGGVYCDVTLRQNGFPGERIGSGIVLVVKTHQTDPRWSGIHYDKDLPIKYFHTVEEIPIFSAAILLVRNPFDAMVSEYNRQLNVNSSDNHILQSRPDQFGNNRKWNDFVFSEAKQWQELIFAFVLGNYGHPVLVVTYEQLQLNLEPELRQMLNFLEVPYQEATLKRVAQNDYTKYKRKKQEMAYYTREQRDHVFDVIQETVNTLTEQSHDHVFHIFDYLRSDIPIVEYDTGV